MGASCPCSCVRVVTLMLCLVRQASHSPGPCLGLLLADVANPVYCTGGFSLRAHPTTHRVGQMYSHPVAVLLPWPAVSINSLTATVLTTTNLYAPHSKSAQHATSHRSRLPVQCCTATAPCAPPATAAALGCSLRMPACLPPRPEGLLERGAPCCACCCCCIVLLRSEEGAVRGLLVPSPPTTRQQAQTQT